MTPLEIIAEWRKGCSCASEGHPEECKECTRIMIDVLERKLQSLREGYVIVPIEPTTEMLQAMRNVIEMSYNKANYAQMYKERHAYKALLLAVAHKQ